MLLLLHKRCGSLLLCFLFCSTYEGEKFTESYLDDEQFLAVLDVIHASKSLLAHSPT